MSTSIKGGGSSNLVSVDSNGNMAVVTPTTDTQAGFAAIISEKDAGTVTGSRTMVAIEGSEDYRLRVGQDQPLFQLSFEGTTIAQGHIQQNLTTMTAAQASGYLGLNSGNATASGNAANVRTYRTFSLCGAYTVYGNLILREANETATNAVSEWGFGYATGTSAPTDGVFFRRLAGGGLRAVVNFGGPAETVATIDTANVPGGDGTGSYAATERNHYLIEFTHNFCKFWINDTLVASIPSPSTQPGPTSAWSQPVFARVYNSGVASAGRRIELGCITVEQADMNSGKDWAHVMAGSGGGAYQAQPGVASGQTANWLNSTVPASASLSNIAAGYTTLGGQYQFAASVTNETDWALFAYQNQIGSATLPGKTLYVTGIRIGEMCVTGAAGVNATMFFWAAAAGSTAVSLATTDAAATVAPRRVSIGSQCFLAAAPIGTQSPGFMVNFDSPLVVPAGCFFHVIVKQLNGAATPSLVWRGTVLVNGYFE